MQKIHISYRKLPLNKVKVIKQVYDRLKSNGDNHHAIFKRCHLDSSQENSTRRFCHKWLSCWLGTGHPTLTQYCNISHKFKTRNFVELLKSITGHILVFSGVTQSNKNNNNNKKQKQQQQKTNKQRNKKNKKKPNKM